MRTLLYSIGFSLLFLAISNSDVYAAVNVNCGQWTTAPVNCLQSISTPNGGSQPATCSAQSMSCPDGTVAYFCGPPTPANICEQFGGSPGGGGIGVNSVTFDRLNETIFGGTPDTSLTTPRGIIGRLLPYLFTFGGLILFIMLIWGGFEMLTGAANPKSQEAGKQRMTAAIIGFILLFGSYWLAQLVQAIFGISIL